MNYKPLEQKGKKSSGKRPKVSKNLNRAEKIEKLLQINSADVTNLQYFCALKKIV